MGGRSVCPRAAGPMQNGRRMTATAGHPAHLESVPVGPFPYVPRVPGPPATELEACDRAVADLRANADRWVRTPIERKRELLDEVLRATMPLIGRWTEPMPAGLAQFSIPIPNELSLLGVEVSTQGTFTWSDQGQLRFQLLNALDLVLGI